MHIFVDYIYKWYQEHHRNLPWRQTKNPYKIWISEIILQQTRVNYGIQYYENFLEKFPDVFTLANAKEDEVLKAWQGLGYYSRARNLYAAAKQIVNEFDGRFPEDYQEILKLKGIGNYTAAAIISFAFDKPYPAIDGNIYRILARYFGIGKPIGTTKSYRLFYDISLDLMDKKRPALHNQALMEFGALMCTPKSPQCKNCELTISCNAFQNNLIEKLPVRPQKAKQKNRYFHYFLIEDKESILIQKRTGKDIWKNLYQLPMVETRIEIKPIEIFDNENFKTLINTHHCILFNHSTLLKHELTHIKIFAYFYHLSIKNVKFAKQFLKINRKDLHLYAFPRLIENYLKTEKIL